MQVAFYFTLGVSIEQWEARGLLERELYHLNPNQSSKIDKLIVIHYGQHSEEIKNFNTSDVEIISYPKSFPKSKFYFIIWSFLLPILITFRYKSIDIHITNQMSGWVPAYLSSLFSRSQFVLRAGYIKSQLELNLRRRNLLHITFLVINDYFAYLFADKVIVTSHINKKWLINRFRFQKEIIVIPSITSIKRSSPVKEVINRKRDFLMINRLSDEKNVSNGIEAIIQAGFSVDCFGDGPLYADLNQKYEVNNKVKILGQKENSYLQKIMMEYKYFLLASPFEGLPKALLEAVSCGCICIGVDTDGVKEVIEDNFNGFLADGPSVLEIQQAILRVKFLHSSEIRRIQENSIKHYQKKFSTKSILNEYNNKVFIN